MFGIGDRIVYPMYGAGEIENIEEKSIEGALERYYVINIPNGNLKIRISIKKADILGLRAVCKKDAVFSIMETIAEKPVMAPDNWNQRYKENMGKIKTGRLMDVAEVVRNLLLRESEKGLSGAEKKMLNNAKQIVLSEIAYAQGIEKDKAEELMSRTLFANFK